MALTETPEAGLGNLAPDFELPGIDGRSWTRDLARGPSGLLVAFICNHCPYVKAIRERLVQDVKAIQKLGFGVVAINANDAERYPEDSFEAMIRFASDAAFCFPYLHDESQQVARAYGAVCTPDFLAYNANLELRYRGRLDSGGAEHDPGDLPRELVAAMDQIARTGRGPEPQYPSMGCSIKWK